MISDMAEVKVGYDMGRLMPYVSLGAGLAKPTSALNGGADRFRGGQRHVCRVGAFTTMTTVGAGVDYAVTDHLTVGVQVNSVQQRGGWGAPLGSAARNAVSGANRRLPSAARAAYNTA